MNGQTCDQCESWISDDGDCACTGYQLSSWGSLGLLVNKMTGDNNATH
jgi:hypothetical protein